MTATKKPKIANMKKMQAKAKAYANKIAQSFLAYKVGQSFMSWTLLNNALLNHFNISVTPITAPQAKSETETLKFLGKKSAINYEADIH